MGAFNAAEADSQPDTIVSRDPSTREELGRVAVATDPEVRAALERARAAQVAWGALPVRERCERLYGFRDAIREHADELAELVSRECGKTRLEALVQEVVNLLDLSGYFLGRGPEILAPRKVPLHLLKHRASYLHYAPRGVVAVISPWNYPLAIAGGEIVMALVAGNAVVHKPSEVTPLIADRTRALFVQAGLPADLYQVVHGRGSVGAALIDARPDFVHFTGSTATGRKIAAACGERLIPCAVELGGKAPAIVCADADLDRTTQALVWGSFANQGQICASIERVYIHAAVYDQLVPRLIETTRRLRLGDPRQPEIDVGVMTWERQLEIVESRIEDAVKRGARLELGGQRRPGGLGFQPTILTGVTHEMDVVTKEIFGPVMPIMKVANEAEAIERANDSEWGLLAYVFTADRDKGRRLAEQIQAGTVMINDVIASHGMPETPWAGVKASGMGRAHSDEGLRDLCQERHVNYDRIALPRELWWYPYSDKLYRRALSALRWLFR
jgi:succinate-semialdehyde dehydrogenase/glutarate-semialdehyde dehydrogenase